MSDNTPQSENNSANINQETAVRPNTSSASQTNVVVDGQTQISVPPSQLAGSPQDSNYEEAGIVKKISLWILLGFSLWCLGWGLFFLVAGIQPHLQSNPNPETSQWKEIGLPIGIFGVVVFLPITALTIRAIRKSLRGNKY